MILSDIKNTFFNNLINIPGWRTNRKIIVIESDDWGSIRMASPQSYQYFLKAGYPVDQHPYNRYDALESQDDLTGLFEVLLSVKDNKGNPAVITANNIVANPDFEKIRQSGYQQYYYETFVESYKRYQNHSNSLSIWKEGLDAKVFVPQLHGREHINVNRWMNALQQNDADTHLAFTHNMFSLHTPPKDWNMREYMDAFRYSTLEEKMQMNVIISEGVTLFKNIWNFGPLSFMAPSYFWFDELESKLNELGVKFIQGSVIQLVPEINLKNGLVKKYHFQGQRNKLGQRYLVRNAIFEPSQDDSLDDINDCLKSISLAFFYKKPAIIQSHRVNYIGYIDPLNRSRNLRLLKNLLVEILKRWPDAEFMTSPQLGQLMNTQK